jgi:murein DD-endopeptidase MepM/ murein hydrolase activator NlpD
MQVCRPWEFGKRYRSLSLTIRFLIGGRGFSLTISPLLILLLAAGLAWGIKVQRARLQADRQQEIAQMEDLKRKNDQLQSLMVHKEKEREQMVKLAEARSEELWLELDSRDQELEKLWKLVGKKPGAKPAHPERTALLGSRSGVRPRSTLEVKRRYRSLMSQIHSSETEIANLSAAAKDYREKKLAEYRAQLASRTPSLWPCPGFFTSPYGYRVHPIYGTGRFHAGCDIAAPMGTEIRATAAGTVITSGWLGGYGQAIEIDHGSGLTTLYGHCSQLIAPVGTVVRKGQVVARVGSTGQSTGPHCHYEVHIGGETTDPAPYLKEKEAPRPVANL